MLLGCAQTEEGEHLSAILWCRYRHIGDGEHIGAIVEPHMGWAIVPYEPSPIHREDDGEVLQGDVVDDRVVGALQEGRVDCDDRSDPLECESCGEGDAMTLSDSHIEVAIGETVPKIPSSRPTRHRCGDHGKIFDLFTELGQSPAEDIGVGGWATRLCHLPTDLVEGRGTMPDDGVFLSEWEALTLPGDDMDEARSLHLLDLAEGIDQVIDIVPIDGSEVAEA